MPKMQKATVTVNIGGDSGNSVEKYDVTVSEVVVLQKIHGGDAVVNIRPTGEVERSNREERSRLEYFYGTPQDDGSKRSKVVDLLFPGAAARMFETFAEAEIDEDFFAQTGRVSSKSPEVVAAAPAAPAADAPAASTTVEADAEPDDGISDMPPVKTDDADKLFA